MVIMSLDKLVNKGFVRYTKNHFSDEADTIIKKAHELYPKLHAKAPEVDHLMPQLVHAKLIRTHTCATGSDSCDYWYVADESETARNFKGTLV